MKDRFDKFIETLEEAREREKLQRELLSQIQKKTRERSLIHKKAWKSEETVDFGGGFGIDLGSCEFSPEQETRSKQLYEELQDLKKRRRKAERERDELLRSLL